MKRRAMTLIEVVIACGLVSVLLTSLLFWYGHLTKMQLNDERARRPLVENYYAYGRLEDIFNRVTLDTLRGSAGFFTQNERDGQQTVVFTLDHGVHPDPKISDIVIGKLYVDRGALCLSIWPQPSMGGVRDEAYKTYVLMEGIESVRWRFLSPRPADFLHVKPEKVGKAPRMGWNEEWDIAYESLPSMVELEIAGAKKLRWVFDLHLPLHVEAS